MIRKTLILKSPDIRLTSIFENSSDEWKLFKPLSENRGCYKVAWFPIKSDITCLLFCPNCFKELIT